MPSCSANLLAASLILSAAAPPPPPDEKPVAPVRVLFIGNSYTYYNNLPELVASLSGGRIETRMVARGGASLRLLWDLGEAPAAIREGKWDIVVLQEQSLLGGMRIDGVEHVNEPDFFHDNIRLYEAEIRKAKAKPLLYLTWARRIAPEQQAHLNYAYATIGQELGIPIAPVGVAWAKVRESEPAIALHDADGTHPSPAGSYLAACVLVRAILGKRTPPTFAPRVSGRPILANERVDPSRTVELVNLTPERAEVLQRAAEEALPPTAGGPKPAYPAHAPLPAAKKPTAAEVSGAWRGWLRFYAIPMQAELKVAADGAQCTAQWTIWSPNDDRRLRMPVSSCRLTEVGVAFTIPDPRGASGPPEMYWSHYTGETITGWADYRGLGKSTRLMGSFELKRVPVAPAAPK